MRLFAEGVPTVTTAEHTSAHLRATGGENDSIARQLARHVKETGER